MRVLYVFLLLVFSPLTWAQVEVVIESLYVRDLVLTEVDSTKGHKTFQVLTEEQSLGYIYKINSAGQEQALIQHDSSLFEKVKIYLDVEKWKMSREDELAPVLFSDDSEDTLKLNEYNSRVESSRAEALLRTGGSFVTKELPHLDQEKANTFVELVKPAQITCTKSQGSQEMKCQQFLQLRFKLQTEQYETFRSKGIEPVLVLRGERERA